MTIGQVLKGSGMRGLHTAGVPGVFDDTAMLSFPIKYEWGIADIESGKVVGMALETPVMLSQLKKSRKKLDVLYHQGQPECRKLWETGKIIGKTVGEVKR